MWKLNQILYLLSLHTMVICFSKYGKIDDTSLAIWTNTVIENIIQQTSYCLLICSTSSQCQEVVAVDKNNTICVLYKPQSALDQQMLVFNNDNNFDLYYVPQDYNTDYIELISTDEKVFKIYDSVSQLTIVPKVDSPITVHGSSAWMVYSQRGYTGKRFLVKQGYGTFTSFFGFTGSTVMSVKKLDQCKDQPIGVQNPHIIPDNAFVELGSLNGDSPWAFEARLYSIDALVENYAASYYPGILKPSGYTSLSSGKIVQVDLRSLYRVYAIESQGGVYIENSGYESPYYTSRYKIEYSTTRSDRNFSAYQDNNGKDVIFNGNNAAYNEVVRNEFPVPFLARHVKVHLLSGRYYGWRMEFYGCKVEDAFTEHRNIDSRGPGPLLQHLIGKSVTECEEACLDLSTCTGFVTWNLYHYSMCWAKSQCHQVSQKLFDVWEKSSDTLTILKACNHNDIFTSSSLEECYESCKSTNSCVAVMIRNGYFNECWLKEAQSIFVPYNSCNYITVHKSKSVKLNEKVLMKNDSSTFVSATTPLSDNDMNTCLENLIKATVNVVINTHLTPSRSVDLSIAHKVMSGCESTITPYVHLKSSLVEDVKGLFVTCTFLEEISRSGNLQVKTYTCVCGYGVCEYVFVDMECVNLCEISIA